MKEQIREILQGTCMIGLFVSLLLVEVSPLATLILLLVFGSLSILFDRGII